MTLPQRQDTGLGYAELSSQFVCMRGHPVTSDGLLKIRKLKADSQANGLTSAEQLLIDAVMHGFSSEHLASRVRSLSPKLAQYLDQALAEHGKTQADPRMEEVKRLVLGRQMISAIKSYRESTGCGLFEAKEACEKLYREHTR